MARTVPRMDEVESQAWLHLVTVLELLPPALDAQLRRDADLTHFEFMVLSVLRFAPDGTLRMSDLADSTSATLARLSHVVSRMERRGIVRRTPSPVDKRATDVSLADGGRRAVIRATPAHLETVRALVLDVLEPTQVAALADIAGRIAAGLDPEDRFAASITRAGDPAPGGPADADHRSAGSDDGPASTARHADR